MVMGCQADAPRLAGEVVSRLPLKPLIFLLGWMNRGKANTGLVLPILAVIGALAIMFVGFRVAGETRPRLLPQWYPAAWARRVGHSVLLPSTTPCGPAPPSSPAAKTTVSAIRTVEKRWEIKSHLVLSERESARRCAPQPLRP